MICTNLGTYLYVQIYGSKLNIAAFISFGWILSEPCDFDGFNLSTVVLR